MIYNAATHSGQENRGPLKAILVSVDYIRGESYRTFVEKIYRKQVMDFRIALNDSLGYTLDPQVVYGKTR